MRLEQLDTDPKRNRPVQFGLSGQALKLDIPDALDIVSRGTGIYENNCRFFSTSPRGLQSLLAEIIGPKPLFLRMISPQIRLTRHYNPADVAKRGLRINEYLGGGLSQESSNEAGFFEHSALPYLLVGEEFSNVELKRWRVVKDGYVFVQQYYRMYGHFRVDLQLNPAMLEEITT